MSSATLINALERTCELLARSQESDWSPLSPIEVVSTLRAAIDALESGRTVDPLMLSIEFAPTSTIQEIAMANGWHDEYMRLAVIVDDHTAAPELIS